MAERTDVFSKRVSDFTRHDVLTVNPETELRETVGRMATEKHTAAIAVDQAGRVAGIVTNKTSSGASR